MCIVSVEIWFGGETCENIWEKGNTNTNSQDGDILWTSHIFLYFSGAIPGLVSVQIEFPPDIFFVERGESRAKK